MNWLDKFVNKHKGIRRTLQLVTIVLIAFATVQMFTNIQSISGAAATAYSTLLVAFAANSGLYNFTRSKEDENGN